MENKRGPGAPPKGFKRLQTNLPPELIQRFKDRARLEGLTVSELMRRVMVRSLARKECEDLAD